MKHEFEILALDVLGAVAPNNFEYHVQQLHANSNYGFNQEYLTINRELRLPYSQSQMQENNAKNRYHNVPAYDHSRVCLMSIDGEPHSDYINANYIQGNLFFQIFQLKITTSIFTTMS